MNLIWITRSDINGKDQNYHLRTPKVDLIFWRTPKFVRFKCFILLHSFLSSGGSTISIFSTSHFQVIMDGILPPSFDIWYPNVGSYIITGTASLITVHVWSKSRAMFLASTPDDWFLSNSSWKCSTPVGGWSVDPFDDTGWPYAVELGSNDGSFLPPVPGISPNARWITSPTPLMEMICRTHFREWSIRPFDKFEFTIE